MSKEKTFVFEIQECIKVSVKAVDKETARMKIINNLSSYAEKMIEDAYVSDGKEENSP